MKKIIIFAALLKVLFAYDTSINYYMFGVDMNYEEYYGSQWLDGDYSDYSDLKGIGIKYSSNYFKSCPLFLKGEFIKGSSEYIGSTWDGDDLKLNKDNVYIYNIEIGAFPLNTPCYLSIGQRVWNRGKSDYPGDYDEKYYWKYVNMGFYYTFNFESFSFSSDISYQHALSPKLDADLGSGTTLNLGTTTGYKVQIQAMYNFSSDLSVGLMYRYQMWHINVSDPGVIIYDNQEIPVVEPESYTRNRYFGASLIYKF